MLTIILSIGPLARLDRRFLPLLYNRRHFGVLTFLRRAAACWFMIEWYRGAGRAAQPHDELTESGRTTASSSAFRSRRSASLALLMLFLMAATSHDFWLVVPHAAGLEGPAHGALRRLRARGDACRARRHAVRPQRR